MNKYSIYISLFFCFSLFSCEPTTENDCPSNQVLENGDCVTPNNNGNINNGSQNNGITVNNNNGTTSGCENAGQCGTNEICAAGICVCDTGTHQCGDECVDNTSIATCGQQCDPCASDENGKTSCEEDSCKLACNDGFRLCDTAQGCPFENGSCISCETNAECLDPKNPTCSNGLCVACETDNDCTIDKPVCASGACEVCSITNEVACGGKTCDPATATCTDIGTGDQGECEPCVSDSQCGQDLYCVPMTFEDLPLTGGFCLKRADLNGCGSPFPIVLADRVSLSGREADRYCGPDESLTTCKAVLDYNNDCGADDDCGLPNLNDAVCAAVEFEFAKCSFKCSQSNQCPSDFSGCWRDLDVDWWCGGF